MLFLAFASMDCLIQPYSYQPQPPSSRLRSFAGTSKKAFFLFAVINDSFAFSRFSDATNLVAVAIASVFYRFLMNNLVRYNQVPFMQQPALLNAFVLPAKPSHFADYLWTFIGYFSASTLSFKG